MQRAIAMIVALGLLLHPLQLLAAGPSKQDKAEAKKVFRQAQLDFKLGKFSTALQGYQKAYSLTSMPALLFNVGQCHRMLGDHEKAVFFYKGYLREKPKARNRAVVEELIADSERILAEALKKQRIQLTEQAELEKRQREEAKRREESRLRHERDMALAKARAEAAKRAREEAEAQARLVAEQEALARAAEEAEPAAYERWWFWTIVVGAVAAAAGGTAWAMTSKETKVLPEGSLGTLDFRSY